MIRERPTIQHLTRPSLQLARAVIVACLAGILVAGSVAGGSVRDRSFGGRGFALVDFGGTDRAVSGFLLDSGRYLLVGQTESPSGEVRIALARLLPSGALDPSFGRDGVVKTSEPAALLREDDGDIVVFFPTGASIAGSRFKSDGSRDRSFGRKIDAHAFIALYPRYFLSGMPIAAVISPRGRIFLGSLAGNDRPRLALDGLAVAFTRDGKPARGFHGDGWRAVDFWALEWFSGSVALPGGRILLAGARRLKPRGPTDAIVLVMLKADGSLRWKFGNRGKVMVRSAPGREEPQAFDLFLDGDRAVVVGEGGGDLLAARFHLEP